MIREDKPKCIGNIPYHENPEPNGMCPVCEHSPIAHLGGKCDQMQCGCLVGIGSDPGKGNWWIIPDDPMPRVDK